MTAVSKRRYRQFLLVLKYLPYILMLIDIINTFSQREPLVAYVGGVSFLGILFMWITSRIFMFCRYHRVPLYYLLANNLLTLAHDYFDMRTIQLDKYLAVAGLTAVALTFIYLIEKKNEFVIADPEESSAENC